MNVSDNGTELTSRAILEWQNETDVAWHYTEPGKPMRNGFVEASTAGYAMECLNEEVFGSLADARRKLNLWRYDYNNSRPQGRDIDKISDEDWHLGMDYYLTSVIRMTRLVTP